MAETTQNGHHEASYVKWETLPEGSKDEDGNPALNKYSAKITRGHDYPGAQVRRVYVSGYSDDAQIVF
jgi:dihydroxy-acid dehydratase